MCACVCDEHVGGECASQCLFSFNSLDQIGNFVPRSAHPRVSETEIWLSKLIGLSAGRPLDL